MSTQPADSADYNTARAQRADTGPAPPKYRKNFPRKTLTPEQRELIVCYLIDQREACRQAAWATREMARTGSSDGLELQLYRWQVKESIFKELINRLEPRTR